MKLKTKLSTLLLGITSIFALTAAIVTNPNSGNAIEAKAADTAYKTALFGSAYNSKKVQDYTSSFSASNEGFTVNVVNANNNNNGWDYIKIGNKTAASVGTITTANAIDKAISKVALTIDKVTAASINSIILEISENNTTYTKVGDYTIATGAQDVKINTPSENCYYRISVDCQKASSNGPIQISKVEYYSVAESSEPSISSVSINETNNIIKLSSSKTLTATVNADEGFTGDMGVTWSSSDDTVATVNSSTGVVTGVKTGKATITATSVADTTKTDSVDVLVLNNSGLTVEDPFASSEAVEAAKLFGTTASTQKYYIKGLVTYASYNTQYNNGEYKLDDVFTLYRVSFNGPFTSADDIKVGYYLTVCGNIVNYNNNIPETTQGADVIAIDKVSSLEITSAPSKLTYNEGEAVDLSGLVITAVYESGLKRVITDYTYTPTGSLTTSTSEIIISYCGVTVSQAIVVNARIATSITITSLPTKTKYYTGTETLDTTGLVVTASYNVGDDADVTSECSLSDVDFSTAGTKTVTVTYKGLTATFDIEVVESEKYSLVTDITQIVEGSKIIIAGEKSGKLYATSDFATNNITAVEATLSGDKIVKTPDIMVMTIGTCSKGYTMKAENDLYLYAASSSSNHLKGQAEASNNAYWSITYTNGKFSVVADKGTNTRNILRYNSSNNLFSCYSSGQEPVKLYVLNPEPTNASKLETFGRLYLNSSENPLVTIETGIGGTSCSGLYLAAKKALSGAWSCIKTDLQNDTTGLALRYEAWARANGDQTPYDGNEAIVNMLNLRATLTNSQSTESSIALVVVIAVISLSSICCYFALNRKKEQK